jgi:hypothetical protein
MVCSRVSCICTRDPCRGSVLNLCSVSDHVCSSGTLWELPARVTGPAVRRRNRWMPAYATTGAYWLAVFNPQLVIASFHDPLLNTTSLVMSFTWGIAPCLGLLGPCAVAAAVLWAVSQLVRGCWQGVTMNGPIASFGLQPWYWLCRARMHAFINSECNPTRWYKLQDGCSIKVFCLQSFILVCAWLRVIPGLCFGLCLCLCAGKGCMQHRNGIGCWAAGLDSL